LEKAQSAHKICRTDPRKDLNPNAIISGRAMTKVSPKNELQWVLKDAGLQELMDRHPEIWKAAGPELVAALEDTRAETLNSFSARAKSAEDMWRNRVRRSRQNTKVIESALPHLIKSRMTLLALNQCYHAAALGQHSAKARFNLVNGYIIQKLLFSRHLTRKPASMKRFRFFWRFVTQKRLLMPLVQPKGIYCFYSRELIEGLRVLLEGKTCLEIAAGDGTLSRFLQERGIQIRATDDYSWSRSIVYPETVERLSAKQALAKYQPQAVVCSWPPPANSFEQKVFSARSVEIYIVIGSRYKFAGGNWDSYTTQDRFEWSIDHSLSAVVLPPELESAVFIFRRKSIS
jgi:hypothetical protein